MFTTDETNFSNASMSSSSNTSIKQPSLAVTRSQHSLDIPLLSELSNLFSKEQTISIATKFCQSPPFLSPLSTDSDSRTKPVKTNITILSELCEILSKRQVVNILSRQCDSPPPVLSPLSPASSDYDSDDDTVDSYHSPYSPLFIGTN